MKEKKLSKRLEQIKQTHVFIPEYVENYTLINTGNRDDMNHYDLKLKDNDHNELVIRKTLRGDNSVDVFVMMKTKNQIYMNKQRTYMADKDPLKIFCMKSEKEWMFSFEGLMISKEKEMINTAFKINFTSNEPIEDLISRLKTNESSKQVLNHRVDQTMIKDPEMTQIVAYQQKGSVQGVIKLNDKTITLNTIGIRHHKFGKHAYQSLFNILQRTL
ncbi:hypothetical protein KHQ89_01355 [Mycoplasmatota bacterium]|nr:hypothetical protein KHQ89_01355 [Mycoplasmatota bacterium]